MILNDSQIKDLCINHEMISPFVDRNINAFLDNDTDTETAAISFGLSSYGYDIRAADEWKLFTNLNSVVVDPKHFKEKSFVDIYSTSDAYERYCIIPPNSFALTRSVEYLKIPKDVFVMCLGKSTYARCGIIVNVTPLEPEWEGHITLEFSNTTPLPAKVYANEGVAQLVFFKGDRPAVTYADRKGKYQGQTGVTLPKA